MESDRPNFGVPLGVFIVAAIGLAVALAYGKYPGDTTPMEKAAGHHESSATPAAGGGHGAGKGHEPATGHAPAVTGHSAAGHDADVTALFDGKTLKNWKATDFGGQGQVEVADGEIVVGAGSTLSGITWTGGELPTVNYEIELDAKKISGSDFVLGLTFPYKKECATFVLGGWGGNLVGLSSINGNDAANNETTTSHEFEKGKWFHVRLRVTSDRIEGWIGDAQKPDLDVETKGKDIGTRADIDAARPLGLSTFQTSAAYKNIKLRKL